MKKSLMLILFLIFSPIVSAISTSMLPAYQPGETMIIEISGNVLQPITPNNIIFKRAHVAIAAVYDVKRIGTKYYLYAQLPIQPNNYTLFINDIATTVNGQPTTIDFNQTFSVAGSIVDYTISPGFAIVENSLILNSILNLDVSTTININFPEEQAFTLQPGANTITLSTSSVSPGVYQAAIGRYTLPVQVLSTAPINQTTSNPNISIQIIPPTIRTIALENISTSYKFSIINTGLVQVENILLSFNTNLFNVTPYFVSTLQPNASQEFNLSLNRLRGQPINTNILIQIGEYNKSIPINISFTVNANQTTQINDTGPQYYCSEIENGKFCAAAETCSTDSVQALDGSCCTGTCEAEDSSGGLGWIGYVSIGVIVLILIIVYLRYKKNSIPSPKNLMAPPSRAIIPSAENKLQLPPGFPSKLEKK